jgi:hypothetical protein
MKTLSCDICPESFSANTFDDWFSQMQAHYMGDHADVMASMADKPKSEGEAWLAAAKKRFAAA